MLIICSICNKRRKKHVKGLCEPCYRTGKIRGILCNPCNSAIAWYENKKKAIKRYLE